MTGCSKSPYARLSSRGVTKSPQSDSLGHLPNHPLGMDEPETVSAEGHHEHKRGEFACCIYVPSIDFWHSNR